jgi:hypothetical protein
VNGPVQKCVRCEQPHDPRLSCFDAHAQQPTSADANRAKLAVERARNLMLDEKLKIWSHVIQRMQKLPERELAGLIVSFAIFFNVGDEVANALKGGR